VFDLHCRRKRGDVTRAALTNRIYAAQIQALYQHTPMVLTVNAVNSALVAIVLASHLGQTRWLVFLALTIVLTGARALGWLRYHACPEASRAAARWAALATLGSGLSGLLWGVGSAVLLPDNLVEQTFVAFVIGGMSAASLVAFSNYLPAFIAYVLPASLPLAYRFFLDGWVVHGDLTVVFAAAMTLAAYNSTRVFANGLRLTLDLTEKTGELIDANQRLEREIEQRRAAEDQLRQAHKMEAIGQLTGGIAHDFNNLLTAVMGNLELAQSRIGDDARVVAPLQVALRASERGAALTRQLLAFARRQHLNPRPVDIRAVVDGAQEILGQTVGPEIRLVIRSEPATYAAWADANQLELAILNLALNARDAMPIGGTLRIEVGNRRRERGPAAADLPPGSYVVVSVSDTGGGMSPEVLAHACEPFFTTKEAGRGSGLGLSIVHGFAAQSGGSVEISSSPGQGTTVELWLPQAKNKPIGAAEPVPEEVCAIERWPARLLVCDDDLDVLAFVGTILRDAGYTISETDSPARALEAIDGQQTIDLLLVDYAMPGMNGLALIDHAQARRPDLKVLLMSGHTDVLQAGNACGIPLLRKPFKVADLRKRVGEILAGRRPELEPAHSGSPALAASN
jgi:signal transduction histidine kinase/ActR/RegA family two-component response regulator